MPEAAFEARHGRRDKVGGRRAAAAAHVAHRQVGGARGAPARGVRLELVELDRWADRRPSSRRAAEEEDERRGCRGRARGPGFGSSSGAGRARRVVTPGANRDFRVRSEPTPQWRCRRCRCRAAARNASLWWYAATAGSPRKRPMNECGACYARRRAVEAGGAKIRCWSNASPRQRSSTARGVERRRVQPVAPCKHRREGVEVRRQFQLQVAQRRRRDGGGAPWRASRSAPAATAVLSRAAVARRISVRYRHEGGDAVADAVMRHDRVAHRRRTRRRSFLLLREIGRVRVGGVQPQPARLDPVRQVRRRQPEARRPSSSRTRGPTCGAPAAGMTSKRTPSNSTPMCVEEQRIGSAIPRLSQVAESR